VAVVTTVAAAHLEFFPSVEAIAAAKAEIFAGLEAGGVAVLNADHPYLTILLEAAREAGVGRVITYGFAPQADWRIEAVEMGDSDTVARIRHGDDTTSLTLGLKGRHMVANAVAALIVGDLFGIERGAALEALEAFGAPEGRGLALRLGPPERPLLLIDESYNANSASMVAALDVFGMQAAPGGKKVLVLGDMLELGSEAPTLHRALKQSVVEAGADLLFLVGPNMALLGETLGAAAVAGQGEGVDDIVQIVLDNLDYGDAIMVKGSNGVRLSALVKAIRNRFE
jgi:UDP-N-acetylmuramoyl-tripeptide--D-alanyl-D-alanine ligase